LEIIQKIIIQNFPGKYEIFLPHITTYDKVPCVELIVAFECRIESYATSILVTIESLHCVLKTIYAVWIE